MVELVDCLGWDQTSQRGWMWGRGEVLTLFGEKLRITLVIVSLL